jgi:hypothetical protein
MTDYIRMLINKDYKILFSLSEESEKNVYDKLLSQAKILKWDCSNIVETYYYDCSKDQFYINKCFAKNIKSYICKIPEWANIEDIIKISHELFDKIYYDYNAYLNACENNYKIYAKLCQLYKENLDRSTDIFWYKNKIREYDEYLNDCKKAEKIYARICDDAEQEKIMRDNIMREMMFIRLGDIEGFVE